MVAQLEQHVAEYPSAPIEHGATLIFSNYDGKPLHRKTLDSAWRKVHVELRLSPDARGWQSVRHAYARSLIKAALPAATVQARLGHASITETLNAFAHLWPNTEDDIA